MGVKWRSSLRVEDDWRNMRIAVMGAGGIGGLYGGLLARGGRDVTLIARGKQLDALQAHGIRINSSVDSFSTPVNATADPANLGAVDVVLFTVKTYHNVDAIPQLRPLMGPESVVLTLQNGVESAEELANEYGPARVIPGVTYAIAQVESPGIVNQLSPDARIVYGEVDGSRSQRAINILESLDVAGITVEISPDVTKLIWSKFLVGAPGNAMSSAARTTPKRLISISEGKRPFYAAMDEITAIGQARGINLGQIEVDQSIAFIESVPLDARGSMLTDIEAGRPLELEAMVGAIGRIGRAVNVPTPIGDLLYTLLLPHKDGS